MAQDSIVGGLFGITPESLDLAQRQREQAMAIQYAGLDPMQRAAYGTFMAGQQLGRGIGSLLGIEDPQLKMITQRQQIMRGIDPNDPEALSKASMLASEMGDPRLAAVLAEQRRKALESQALVAQRTAAAKREQKTAIPTNIQEAQYVATLRNDRNQIAALTDSEVMARYGIEKTAALANIDAQLSQLVKSEKQESRTEIQKLLDARNKLDPVANKQEYDALSGRINILTTRAPGTSVSVKLPPQERSEQGRRGEMLVDEYKDISKAAKLAAKSLPSLQIQEGIIDAGFKTGFGAPAQKAAASVLGALGITDAEKFATNAQTFYAASQGAVLQKQLEQKGPQTEADAQRITATGAQLGNTPEANKFIINVAKAQLKRDIKQRDFYDDWWRKNKTYDGAENAWMTGEGAKSLFDYPELKAYKIGKESSGAAGTWRVVKE